SSIVLGLLGIGLGVAVEHLTHVETIRGSFASWGLIAVGLVYGAWGLHRALRGERHVHVGPEPLLHSHAHDHGHPHSHARSHSHAHDPRHHHHHEPQQDWRTLTPWVLFVVFVLGPCEPLIPLVMVPAAAGSAIGVAVVSGVFAAATLIAMLAAVGIGRLGL